MAVTQNLLQAPVVLDPVQIKELASTIPDFK